MQSLELVEYLSVSFRLLSLTIWAIFFSVVLYLSLTEAPLGVNTEVWDALIGGLLETVLHLGGEWCPGPYSNLFFGPLLFWKIKHIKTQIFWVNIWRVCPNRNWTINVFQNWYYHYWVTICNVEFANFPRSITLDHIFITSILKCKWQLQISSVSAKARSQHGRISRWDLVCILLRRECVSLSLVDKDTN